LLRRSDDTPVFVERIPVSRRLFGWFACAWAGLAVVWGSGCSETSRASSVPYANDPNRNNSLENKPPPDPPQAPLPQFVQWMGK
jgi:hypothetical protein